MTLADDNNDRCDHNQPKATLVAGNFAHIQRCYKFRHILLISGPEMTIIIFTVIMTMADDNDDR